MRFVRVAFRICGYSNAEEITILPPYVPDEVDGPDEFLVVLFGFLLFFTALRVELILLFPGRIAS